VRVGDAVAAGRLRLRAAGIPDDEADLDARLLAEHVLGWTTERFLAEATASASPSFVQRYNDVVARRERREPVSYVVGHQEFWGLDFEVSPAVLIPRPETELVVETALQLLGAAATAGSDIRVADVCTGSGCVAVAIACERQQATIVAIDISEAALAVAQRNARRHGVAERIRLVRADLLDGVEERFDLIAANPPYVAESDRAGLQPEVRDYEPALALFAGTDGLDAIKRLLDTVPDHLRPGGWFLFEFGFGQSDEIVRLISRAAALTMIELRHDLQEIPRVAVVRKG
jgi:release factor glutamine methyltransferase